MVRHKLGKVKLELPHKKDWPRFWVAPVLPRGVIHKSPDYYQGRGPTWMLSFIRSVLSPMAVGIYSNISSIKLYIRSFIRSEMGTLLIMDEITVIHWMLGCLSIGKNVSHGQQTREPPWMSFIRSFSPVVGWY